MTQPDPQRDGPTSAKWLRWLVVAALPFVLLWPAPLVFTSHVLAHPDREAVQHLWGLWAAWQELQAPVVHSHHIAWPIGFDFVLIDPGNLPWFALGSLLGPVAAFNLVLIGNLWLAGLAGALLTRVAGGTAAQRWLGAVAAMSCPALLSSSAEGITESFAVGWCGIALAATLLHCRDDRPGWRGAAWGALASVALGWSVWSGPYNGLWAGLLFAGAALVRWRQWRRWLPIGLAGAGLALPVAWAMLTARRDGLPGTPSRVEWELPHADPEHFRGGFKLGADLTDPFLPELLTGGQADAGHTAYLGIVALVLAGVAVWRVRRRWPWLAAALTFAVLALGTWLIVLGRPVPLGDTWLVAPVGQAAKLFPPLLRVTRWYRAAAVGGLLLAPLVALSVPRLRWLAAGALVLDACLLAPRAWPVEHFDGRPAPFWASLDRPGAVVDLPPAQSSFSPEGTVRDENLLQQTWHGRPNAATFFNLSGGAADSREVRALFDLAIGKPGPPDAPRRLAGMGYAWVVVDQRRFAHLDEAALSRVLGPPVYRDPTWLVHALPEGVPKVEPDFPPFFSPRPTPGGSSKPRSPPR